MNNDKRNKSPRGVDDPTANTNNMLNDTTGLTGMTQNNTNTDVGAHDGSSLETESATRARVDDDLADDKDTQRKPIKPMTAHYQREQATESLNSDEGNNRHYIVPTSPSVQGETSVSGDMPDPESDDDTLANAQFMGQQANEDEEHPQELDIARDLDEAEEYIRTH